MLAAVGSSDPYARADGATAARLLARELRAPVTLATIAMGELRVPDAVARLRADGAERVAVASWLLAPGLFQRALVASGADVVAEPLATHEAVAPAGGGALHRRARQPDLGGVAAQTASLHFRTASPVSAR